MDPKGQTSFLFILRAVFNRDICKFLVEGENKIYFMNFNFFGKPVPPLALWAFLLQTGIWHEIKSSCVKDVDVTL